MRDISILAGLCSGLGPSTTMLGVGRELRVCRATRFSGTGSLIEARPVDVPARLSFDVPSGAEDPFS